MPDSWTRDSGCCAEKTLWDRGVGVADALRDCDSDLIQLRRDHVPVLAEFVGNVKRSALKVDDNV